MTLARFELLIAAYGADAARWPDDERAAALRLLARSAAARALLADAMPLDRMLDEATVVPASSPLAARILADAPSPTRPWRQRMALAALAPLALAAGLALWVRTPESRQVALRTVAVGEYGSPTDVLLGSYAMSDATVPAIGCAESSLGCPRLETGSGARRPSEEGA